MHAFLRSKLTWFVAALVVLVGLYALLGFYAAPRLVRSQAIDHVRETYGRTLTLGDVRIHPFKLQAEVRDLSLPVKVIAAPILRADDGLALSSRNQYLSVEERTRAPLIHDTLLKMRELLEQGHPWRALEQVAESRLARAGFVPDYAAIRRAEDLTEPEEGERDGLVALIAARLGDTRLIDNLLLD